MTSPHLLEILFWFSRKRQLWPYPVVCWGVYRKEGAKYDPLSLFLAQTSRTSRHCADKLHLKIFTFVDILCDAFMNLQVILLVEKDFIAIEYVQSTSNSPKISREDETIVISFVSMGAEGQTKKWVPDLLKHQWSVLKLILVPLLKDL